MIAWLTQTEGRAFGAYLILCAAIGFAVGPLDPSPLRMLVIAVACVALNRLAEARGYREASDECADAMRQWDEAQRRTNGGAA